MQSGVEGVVLDATHYRNLGAFINHSATPNAQAECIFDKGVEQAVIIATRHIPRGHQILIDYSERYFGKNQSLHDYVDLTKAGPEELPTWLPSSAFASLSQ
jgi:SET domain-containing protein